MISQHCPHFPHLQHPRSTVYLCTMIFRSTTFFLLNQTNDELVFDLDSPKFVHCHFIQGSEPPRSIVGGQYGTWVLASERPMNHMTGVLRYDIAGLTSQEKVTFCWNTAILGKISYEGLNAPKGYKIDFLGGRGFHSVVIFILSTHADISCI